MAKSRKRKTVKSRKHRSGPPSMPPSASVPPAPLTRVAFASPGNKQGEQHPDKKPDAKEKESPKRRSGGFKLYMIYGLFSQIALSVLFCLFLAFALYYLKEQPPRAYWFFFLAWVSVGLAVTFFFLERVDVETEISGVLRPANDPSPGTGCSAPPPNAITVFAGGGAASTTLAATTVINVAGEDLLSIKQGDTGLLLSAKLYSPDTRIVAQIVDNEFYINPNNYFRRERPDRHTLVVYDQQAREVLNVRFLNPSAVRLTGIFHSRTSPPVVVGEQNIRIGGITFTGACSHNAHIMFGL